MGTTPHEADVTSSNSLSPSCVDMKKKKKKKKKKKAMARASFIKRQDVSILV